MGCCGRSNNPNRVIRSQKTQKQKVKPSKAASVKSIPRPTQSEPSHTGNISNYVTRQKIVKINRCAECNHPTVMVNISGRQREQCSNANCRKIKR